jgi:hypothetical protein
MNSYTNTNSRHLLRSPIKSARSAAFFTVNHSGSLSRDSGMMSTRSPIASRGSREVPAYGYSIYETNAKSNPPSQSIVIVMLISLSYSR